MDANQQWTDWAGFHLCDDTFQMANFYVLAHSSTIQV